MHAVLAASTHYKVRTGLNLLRRACLVAPHTRSPAKFYLQHGVDPAAVLDIFITERSVFMLR